MPGTEKVTQDEKLTEMPDGTEIPETEKMLPDGNGEPVQELSFEEEFRKNLEDAEKETGKTADELTTPEAGPQPVIPPAVPPAPPQEPPAPVAEPVAAVEPLEPKDPLAEVKEKAPFLEMIEGEINLEDQEEIDSLEYWAKGKKADWTKHRENFTDEQKEKFAKYQSAYDRYQVEQHKAPEVAPVPTPPNLSEDSMKEYVADLRGFMSDDPGIRDATIKKYEKYLGTKDIGAESPQTIQKVDISKDAIKKLSEAFESQDGGQFAEGISELISDISHKAEERASQAEKNALQSFEKNKEQERTNQWLDQVERDVEDYRQKEGSAFTQYEDRIHRYLSLGFDPWNGQEVGGVKDAYEICKGHDSGGSALINRPEPSALPIKSSEGQSAGLTEEDLDGDFKNVVRKVMKEEGYKG